MKKKERRRGHAKGRAKVDIKSEENFCETPIGRFRLQTEPRVDPGFHLQPKVKLIMVCHTTGKHAGQTGITGFICSQF